MKQSRNLSKSSASRIKLLRSELGVSQATLGGVFRRGSEHNFQMGTRGFGAKQDR